MRRRAHLLDFFEENLRPKGIPFVFRVVLPRRRVGFFAGDFLNQRADIRAQMLLDPFRSQVGFFQAVMQKSRRQHRFVGHQTHVAKPIHHIDRVGQVGKGVLAVPILPLVRAIGKFQGFVKSVGHGRVYLTPPGLNLRSKRKMRFLTLFATSFVLISAANAQFVRPKTEYNRPEPGVYTEDPFIIKYRAEYFAVFKGDRARFERAHQEIGEMVRKNPKDPRALVWYGNGQTVKAALAYITGKRKEADELAERSRQNLDKAVAMRPDDPNIYMMRAATLYVQGQYFPKDAVPRVTWERLRDDCLTFIKFLGDRITRVSIHVRGETYGELGIAYLNLGEKEKARQAFQRVVELCPNTAYSERALREIAALGQ
jgi:hypothetical protein